MSIGSLRISHVLTALLAALLMIGCADSGRNETAVAVADTDTGVAAPAVAAAATGAPRIVFLGTSLTAGLGLSGSQAYPALIQEKIDSAGLNYEVVNGGVSGETSAGALRRIDWLLRQPFDVLVLETGANDMLRGVPPEEVEANIRSILDQVRADRPEARIILAGMRAAPNLGPRYVRDFEAIYPRLAEEYDLELIPFLLEGVAADPELNQNDGIHPTAEGQRIVAATVWEQLEPGLE